MLGLSEAYVATLHSAARRDGSAALAIQDRRGTPGKVTAAQWEQARAWRDQGASDAEIGRRLGVANTTVGRGLGPRGQALAGDDAAGRAPADPLFSEPEPAGAEPEPGAGAGLPPGGGPAAWPLPAEGALWSRYAGAMLLYGFLAQAGAGTVLAAAAREPGDTLLLSAVSMGFALGAATTEQFKHLAAAEAGPLAGLAALPGLRALRPRLAAIADRTDPVALQRMFASAMLAVDPVTSGVYYVDDHFVPYTGAKPVAKGWNNKRGRAEKGRADTHVTAHDGRAVCFVTGEPSGLSVTLPRALAELKKAAGPGAAIMLGFDRGGAYPQVFAHCRDQGVHWVTYRRAPLAVPATLPVITAVTYAGRTRQLAWAEEKVRLKDYGEARQITLFEHGKVALQILTSDCDACPAEILSWLKSRWREENFLKYASENYGIDKICDYLASIETNTKLIRNPARDQANAAVRDADKALAAAERELAGLLADPAVTPAAKNARIPALQEKITSARAAAAAAVTARKPIPAKLPASAIDPDAKTALLRAPARPADGPAAARPQRRALAIEPAQRLPARRRRVPRHHPPDHHPRPGRHHHLDPRRDHRHPRATRRPPHRPRPQPADRGDQRHPARDDRRQPPHHLPPRTPAQHLTPYAQPSPEIGPGSAPGRSGASGASTPAVDRYVAWSWVICRW